MDPSELAQVVGSDTVGTTISESLHPLGGMAVVEVDGQRVLMGGIVPLDGNSSVDDLDDRPRFAGSDVNPLDRAATPTCPKIVLPRHMGTDERARLYGTMVDVLPLPSSNFSDLIVDRRIQQVRDRLGDRGRRFFVIELACS